jgi:hypothetical protein
MLSFWLKLAIIMIKGHFFCKGNIAQWGGTPYGAFSAIRILQIP